MISARIFVLLLRIRDVALDEGTRRENPDIRKLKSGARSARHRLQSAHSEAPQEAPTVIGLPGPRHAVPVVGETPAACTYQQVTNVVRAPHLWPRQGTEPARIGADRILRTPFAICAPGNCVAARPPCEETIPASARALSFVVFWTA